MLQAEVPEAENDLEAIVYFTRTDNLRQKLLYLQCIKAAASAADYHDAVDTLVPLLEELGRDEDQPEEVRLEVAVQLAALGKLRLQEVQFIHPIIVSMYHSAGVAEPCPVAGKVFHQQQQADKSVLQGFNPLVQLQSLAVSLLEDENETVRPQYSISHHGTSPAVMWHV